MIEYIIVRGVYYFNVEQQLIARRKADASRDLVSIVQKYAKIIYEKALRIVSMRSNLENFVIKLYPLGTNAKTNEMIYGKPEKLSTCDAVSEIFSSTDKRFCDDPFVKIVRDRLSKKNIEPKVFMKFARWLYNQVSDEVCHKMSAYAPPLPHHDDVKAIEDMLQAVEVDRDVPAVICIQIILEPLPLP